VPPPTQAPANAADELFPDNFRANALDLKPVDALGTPRAFEPVAYEVVLRSAYLDAGLVPPLELIVAAPNGVHEARELAELPLAVVYTPLGGGRHTLTLRELAHNQWWGQVFVDVEGERAS
jgi:hypothetical protein